MRRSKGIHLDRRQKKCDEGLVLRRMCAGGAGRVVATERRLTLLQRRRGTYEIPHFTTLALWIGITAVAIQPAHAGDPGPAFAPDHVIRLEEHHTACGVLFSHDGQHLYVTTELWVTNVWSLLVYHWPEILGAIVALSALAWIVALIRCVRRKRLPGKPHCRRCNYCLEGSPTDRCPECGCPQAVPRAVYARPLWRRMLVPSTLLALGAAGYFSLRFAGVPRVSNVNFWVVWPSRGLLDWLLLHAPNRPETIEANDTVYRLIDIDVTAGTLQRTFAGCSSIDVSLVNSLSPDGRLLVVSAGDGELSALRSDSGRSVAHASIPGSVVRPCRVAGFSQDGGLAYLALANKAANKTSLFAWNLATNHVSHVFDAEVSLFTMPRTGEIKTLARDLHVVFGSASLVVDRPPSWLIAAEQEPTLVRELNHGGRIKATIKTPLSSADPVFTADGRRMFMFTAPPDHVLTEWDLETGKQLRTLNCPSQTGMYGEVTPALDRARNLIFVAAHNWSGQSPSGVPEILVGDVEKRRWVAHLDCPQPRAPTQLTLSRDGNSLVAVCTDNTAGPLSETDLLLVYDLTALHAGAP